MTKMRTDPRTPIELAIGYIRVSTDEQGQSGLGMEVQRRAIEGHCAARGWTLVGVCEDVASGKTTHGRPGLASAISTVQSGEAGTLVIAKLDRLSRSVIDFSTTLGQAKKEGWNLAILDLGVDLSTPVGTAMANMAATFAQLERELISERTKSALAVRAAQGVQLGRPRRIPTTIIARIRTLRASGASLRAICRTLDVEGIPTVEGGSWRPQTIHRLIANPS